ncbi:hypothetical protein M0R45_037989 [Rubus argutus]|uniref:F-box domain-containing protein n=1 Tax=Rubus argutus TaxID=59490 RepID=A0AAW1W5S5_RUBAR
MDSLDWANLPVNLLDLVLEKLSSPSDYLRFSDVCMLWNSVAKDNISKRTAPMLLTYTGKAETWSLCDIIEDTVIMQLELPNKRFCGFSKGWLITMDANFVVTLINPFSRIKGRKAKENSIIALSALKLPKTFEQRTRWAKQCDHYIFKATISADPISNAEDCIVVVIYEESCQLAFIRLEKDTRWTYIDIQCRQIEEVVYVEDTFYAIDYLNKLFSFQVTAHEFNSDEDVILVAEGFKPGDICKRYLVELSENELLMVQRYFDYKDRRRVTTKFEVFKVDDYNCEWTKINSLGDVALFVGENSSISVLASKNLGCLPQNCIYFLHDWDRHAIDFGHGGGDFGVYNIKNKSLLPIDTTHAATLLKMSDQTAIWAFRS